MAILSSDSVGLYAEAMIEAIKREIPDAVVITRDDLLYLTCFAHVATITRYAYVCRAVRYAVDRKWMIEGAANQLFLSGQSRRYADAVSAGEAYEATVEKLVPRRGTVFTVAHIINKWNTDQHLTYNTKRVYVRNILKRMLRRGDIKDTSFNVFERA